MRGLWGNPLPALADPGFCMLDIFDATIGAFPFIQYPASSTQYLSNYSNKFVELRITG